MDGLIESNGKGMKNERETEDVLTNLTFFILGPIPTMYPFEREKRPVAA